MQVANIGGIYSDALKYLRFVLLRSVMLFSPGVFAQSWISLRIFKTDYRQTFGDANQNWALASFTDRSRRIITPRKPTRSFQYYDHMYG